jgi:hypothetical protein
MENNLYKACTRSDKQSPYKDMVDGVYGKDTSISKATCPTAEDLMTTSPIDISKRIINLDSGPRPEYYGGKDNPYEVFRVLEEWELDKDFYLGNVIKYVARAGKKDSSKKKEDLQKALVYLQRRINSL